jgi:hypothetical protein
VLHFTLNKANNAGSIEMILEHGGVLKVMRNKSLKLELIMVISIGHNIASWVIMIQEPSEEVNIRLCRFPSFY